MKEIEYLDFLAYLVREEIRTSGAKVRKAIKKVAYRQGFTWSNDHVEAICALVDGAELEISTQKSVWVEGYSACQSCMQGKGALVHEAYMPHGAQIAVLRIQGAVCARAIVNPGTGVHAQVYGSQHFVLATLLDLLGWKRGSAYGHLGGGGWDSIIAVKKTEKRETAYEAESWERISLYEYCTGSFDRTACVDTQVWDYETQALKVGKAYYGITLVKGVLTTYQTETIFRPYVD